MSKNYEALSQMNLLETLIRQSLTPEVVQAPEIQTDRTVTAPAPEPKSPPLFATSRDEYRPALQDHSIIEALLNFQKSIVPSSSPHAHGIEFVPPAIPRIETEMKRGLKPSSIHRPKGSR